MTRASTISLRRWKNPWNQYDKVSARSDCSQGPKRIADLASHIPERQEKMKCGICLTAFALLLLRLG